ncbi:uncharacterized protein LOC126316682 [Schistocerca gregaria]|uniref:uncharacterized protein LOC126316682 n=1 Tax=Schistocerca gregaria TaxID=7010 RepID=UPI00211E3353|nr:uncharacterized protein LOC126316682 [Schistocerca gregaria]
MLMGDSNVLILGGCGFVGRNLVSYLVDNKLCKYIRVIDKTRPSLAYLSERHKKAFESDIVSYEQANVRSPSSLASSWTKSGKEFHYVFNLASETRYAQDSVIYNENIVSIVKIVIAEIKKHPSVKRVFDISTNQVYNMHDKKILVTEDSATNPKSPLAAHKLTAEGLWLESGLPVIILRSATIYGLGDIRGLSPLFACARVYAELKQKLVMLWSDNSQLKLVHVMDVCRALWHLTDHGDARKIYNICCDKVITSADLCRCTENLFGIRIKMANRLFCKLSRLNIQYIIDYANLKHLKVWTKLCNRSGIESTPVTPVVYEENIRSPSYPSIDVSLLLSTNFEFKYPSLHESILKEQLNYWVDQGVFPPLETQEVLETDILSGSESLDKYIEGL